MKIVVRTIEKGGVPEQAQQKHNNLKYGTWGTVSDVNSRLNAVTVVLSSGVELKDIPVATTDEWVCEYDGYVSGCRNLPPEKSRVFVLMPTGNFDSAFVLCSGLSMYEKKQKSAFMAQDESELEEKNTERARVLPGKWKETYDYKKASYALISPSEKIKVAIHDDDEKKEAKIEAFGSEIKIDKDGNVSVKAAQDKKLTLNGDNHKGLVKAVELKEELGKMTGRIDRIIDALQKANPVPQDGGATYKAQILLLLGFTPPLPAQNAQPPSDPPQGPPMGKEDFSNIQNANVVHGG